MTQAAFEFTPNTKVCKRCGEAKPLDQYYHSWVTTSAGNRYRYPKLECKSCTTEVRRPYLQEYHKRDASLKKPRPNYKPPAMDGEQTCPDCGSTKNITEFPIYRTQGREYRSVRCGSCKRAFDREKSNRWKEGNPERHRAQLNAQSAKYYANKDCFSKRVSEKTKAIKRQVFDHYGAVCACCGEKNYGFLTLDHINDDGAEHRRKIGTGRAYWKWVIANNYPDTLRVLCFNCNSGRHWNGGVCPHELSRRTPEVMQGILSLPG